MFNVRLSYNHNEIRTVYGVQQLENGLTQFLVWNVTLNKWDWMPSSQYVPLNLEKNRKE